MDDPEELWTCFSAIMESTCAGDFHTLKPILEATKKYFEKKGERGIARYINEILLKESEVEPGDWDNIRFLLHWEFDKDQPEPTDFLAKIKAKYGF